MSENDRLTHLARAGRLRRRQFHVRAAALGDGAAAATSILGRAASAQTPHQGGDLVIGLDGAGATDSLDPATYTATYMQTVGYQFGNCLVELDENNDVIPELAESWEPNADATQWVFKLKKGVEFHDGKEMTAADVISSINHHRGTDSTSGAQGYLQVVADIRATDTHEVTVDLSAASADLPSIHARPSRPGRSM
jgi:peptide/nickel transport system substrate-binding protein